MKPTYIRRLAMQALNDHDPDKQEDNRPANRCARCNFVRHPCETFELAEAVLTLLDDGLTGAERYFAQRLEDPEYRQAYEDAQGESHLHHPAASSHRRRGGRSA